MRNKDHDNRVMSLCISGIAFISICMPVLICLYAADRMAYKDDIG